MTTFSLGSRRIFYDYVSGTSMLSKRILVSVVRLYTVRNISRISSSFLYTNRFSLDYTRPGASFIPIRQFSSNKNDNEDGNESPPPPADPMNEEEQDTLYVDHTSDPISHVCCFHPARAIRKYLDAFASYRPR